MKPPLIGPDIRAADTLPGSFYGDPAAYSAQVEHVLRALVPRRRRRRGDRGPRVRSYPSRCCPGSLDEPLVLTRDEGGTLRALSNVCTHRANLLAHEGGPAKSLVCRYHGRRFGLDGVCRHMPRFEEALDFPSIRDNLPEVALGTLGPLIFAGLAPPASFADMCSLFKRARALPWDALVADPAASRDYVVRAHWALYCDNYLEGFHIPFVHPALARAVELTSYRTELLPWGTLQLAAAAPGEPAFEEGNERIAAYYAWLYPTTMLNFYPWGLSVNLVRPAGPERTVVSFRSYVADASQRGRGAGGDLHAVELEDEAIVEAVQRGVRSRLYDRGRYSPSEERGVFHFHRLLDAAFAAHAAG
jgi:choline monooxygenase